MMLGAVVLELCFWGCGFGVVILGLWCGAVMLGAVIFVVVILGL